MKTYLVRKIGDKWEICGGIYTVNAKSPEDAADKVNEFISINNLSDKQYSYFMEEIDTKTKEVKQIQ